MELSEYRLKELGRLTAKYVKKFYEDPENEKRFQEWYRQNYEKVLCPALHVHAAQQQLLHPPQPERGEPG